MNAFFNRIFRFLASLQLAVINISFLAIILTVATFYESKYSTELAQQNIYSTVWFDFLLFLFGVNVTCAALVRYPWKKRHTGFVITHIGLIIILLGSMVTRKFGVEGQMILQEGQSTSHISISNDVVLSAALPNKNIQETFDPWFLDSAIPKGSEVEYQIADTGAKVFVDEYYFNPRVSESITNDGLNPNPAVKISVMAPNAPNPFEDWLFANVPGRAAFNLNIAAVHFHGVLSDAEIAARFNPMQDKPESASKGTIELKTDGGEVVHTMLLEDIEKGPIAFSYNDQRFVATLIDFFMSAAVDDNKLINKPGGAQNPAIKFSLESANGKEEHLAFALFPEFGSLHGEQESFSGLKAGLTIAEDSHAGHKHDGNAVDLFFTKDHKLRYQASNHQGNTTMGEAQVGVPFDTTWNGVMMTVDQFYPNAKINQIVTDAGRNAPQPHNNPVIKARVEFNGGSASDFVVFNSPKVMRVGGESIVVDFGQRKVDVGFTVTLVDFRAPRYPGTNQPERFESDVVLTVPEKGIERKQKVFMNNPLIENDFKVYQASYIEGRNGGPDTSIFSVARAPGTPVIYVGSIIMVLGMIILYRHRDLYFMKNKEFDWSS